MACCCSVSFCMVFCMVFWVVFCPFWVVALSGYSNLNIIHIPEASYKVSTVHPSGNTPPFIISKDVSSYKRKSSQIKSNCFIFKWCHRESNQGHKDFQSFALPLCISLRATVLAIVFSLWSKHFGKQGYAFWVKHYSLIYHCAFLHLHPQLSHPLFAAVRGYQAL